MTNQIYCSDCEIPMKVTKVGVYVVEYSANGPYAIWLADMLRCQCGYGIITRFGDQPIYRHDQPGFDHFLENTVRKNQWRRGFENLKQRQEVVGARAVR